MEDDIIVEDLQSFLNKNYIDEMNNKYEKLLEEYENLI